jgi:hypothetical protein
MGNDFYTYRLDGESQITPEGMLKGEIVEKDKMGLYVKTGRKVIIKDWALCEIIEDTQEGF